MTAKELFQNIIPHRHMQFAPVEEDDDAISQSIANDPAVHDNQWQLDDTIDPRQLESFWIDTAKELSDLEQDQN